MSQPLNLMTVLASITMPDFTADERSVLHRVERVLARHPYMRADLGDAGPLAKELESVLSTRLALLHTEGGSESTGPLLCKLETWERELATVVAEEDGSKEARLRYETTRLLHPAPHALEERQDALPPLAVLTRAWEARRMGRSLRSLLLEKIQQNRDFFRHGAMLPFYWLRRWRIRKRMPSMVLGHPALRETFFAIEQVGPVVDNFAFKGAAGLPFSISVAVADTAFLYMQLADEFLDELAAASGGHDSVGLLLHRLYRNNTRERPLRDLSLVHLREIGVAPEKHQTKFGMTLSELFEALDEVAASIDSLLADSDAQTVHATHLFLHHCFQTFLDEIELREGSPGHRADQLRLQDVAWHFYRKNNMVMMLWLDLRARLLGLNPSRHADAIRRWGYLLSSFQIFDDLKDIALDLGCQPSYPLQIAANDFPEEFDWIERRFGACRRPMTRAEVPEVNLGARETVQQCMGWSRLIALAHFDNALLYAWDQRWRKSWMARRRSFNPGTPKTEQPRAHAVDRLVRALAATGRTGASSAAGEQHLAFALDAAAYDGSWQIYLALFPNLRAIYRFATLRMWMTAEEKARAARRLLRRYPRARDKALVGLFDGDVDHQVAGDGLEAFAKLIEV